MKLNEYINRFPRNERRSVREAIARHAGVKEPVIRHYANGTRPVPPRHAIAIAEATEFKVRPHDLCADVYPYPTDGIPPSVREAAATTGSQHAGDMTAQSGQAGLSAGCGQAFGEQCVELRDHRVSDVRRLAGDGIEQHQQSELDRPGSISKKNNSSLLGASAFGHVGHSSVSVSTSPRYEDRCSTALNSSCVALTGGD